MKTPTFFQGYSGLRQTPGGAVAAPVAPTSAAVLARRREISPAVVYFARLAAQRGLADATGPAAVGISAVALKAALSAALNASEPGFPSYFDEGILDTFFDSKTVVYVTYPAGAALYWWQSFTIAADNRSIKLNGDRQAIETGWLPVGPVPTPPAAITPTPTASASTATATRASGTPTTAADLRELSEFMRSSQSMSYTPPRIFDNALHAMGRPGIGESPAAYAASQATATRPGPDVAAACLSRSVMQAFTIDELVLLQTVHPGALAPLAAAGRNADSHARAFRALGQTPNPNLRDCDLWALSAARGALDRAKAANGNASAPGCGCSGHPTSAPAVPTASAASTTGGGYRPPKIFDAALIAKGLPPIGGKR